MLNVCFYLQASNIPPTGRYYPTTFHWFFEESKEPSMWKPFSLNDSLQLEEICRQGKLIFIL